MAVALYTTREGHNPLVLISVHEGRHIREELHDGRGRPLGIEDPSDLERHIARDLGIGDVTAPLADATGAHVFRVTHSRLVADLNRFEDELECIAPCADGTEIPLNKALTDQQRSARLARFYFPVLEALNAFVADVARNAGTEPFAISMHSYARTQKTTPTPKREDVCVFGYPEFGPSPKLEQFVQNMRAQNPALVIGNNRPFPARTPGLRTAEGDPRMACPVTYFMSCNGITSSTISAWKYVKTSLRHRTPAEGLPNNSRMPWRLLSLFLLGPDWSDWIAPSQSNDGCITSDIAMMKTRAVSRFASARRLQSHGAIAQAARRAIPRGYVSRSNRAGSS